MKFSEIFPKMEPERGASSLNETLKNFIAYHREFFYCPVINSQHSSFSFQVIWKFIWKLNTFGLFLNTIFQLVKFYHYSKLNDSSEVLQVTSIGYSTYGVIESMSGELWRGGVIVRSVFCLFIISIYINWLSIKTKLAPVALFRAKLNVFSYFLFNICFAIVTNAFCRIWLKNCFVGCCILSGNNSPHVKNFISFGTHIATHSEFKVKNPITKFDLSSIFRLGSKCLEAFLHSQSPAFVLSTSFQQSLRIHRRRVRRQQWSIK